MRRLLPSFCAVAALLPLAACVGKTTLAAPVSVVAVRHVAMEPAKDAAIHASILHTPLGLSLHKEAKAALGQDAIDWMKQDVLVVHLDRPGLRLGDLRIKGYVLYVPLVDDGAGAAAADATCLVAVLEKTRATEVVIEQE